MRPFFIRQASGGFDQEDGQVLRVLGLLVGGTETMNLREARYGGLEMAEGV